MVFYREGPSPAGIEWVFSENGWYGRPFTVYFLFLLNGQFTVFVPMQENHNVLCLLYYCYHVRQEQGCWEVSIYRWFPWRMCNIFEDLGNVGGRYGATIWIQTITGINSALSYSSTIILRWRAGQTYLHIPRAPLLKFNTGIITVFPSSRKPSFLTLSLDSSSWT